MLRPLRRRTRRDDTAAARSLDGSDDRPPARPACCASAGLANPTPHRGKVYELTGPRSQDMNGFAAELSEALGRMVTYVDVPFDAWRDQELRGKGLPPHLSAHLATMARLHAENRYDRHTDAVEAITGRPPAGLREFAPQHPELFGPLRRR